MTRRRRKLTKAERAEKRRRQQEYETVFINGRMKRVRRPPMIDGLTVDEFIRQNADVIFLHQEGLWEYIDEPRSEPHESAQRESVSFITTETDDDLIVAYAIAWSEFGDIRSLILQRNPRLESLLPSEDRGVVVSHEAVFDEERAMVERITIDGPDVDIHTARRNYRIDMSGVEPDEIAAANAVLRHMHRFGGFELEIR